MFKNTMEKRHSPDLLIFWEWIGWKCETSNTCFTWCIEADARWVTPGRLSVLLIHLCTTWEYIILYSIKLIFQLDMGCTLLLRWFMMFVIPRSGILVMKWYWGQTRTRWRADSTQKWITEFLKALMRITTLWEPGWMPFYVGALYHVCASRGTSISTPNNAAVTNMFTPNSSTAMISIDKVKWIQL